MAEPEWPRYLKRCRVCGGDWTPLNQQTGRYDYCEQCVPGGYQLAWSAPGWEPAAMDALLIEDRDRLKREMEVGFYGQRQCGIVDCHACHERAATLADLALTAVRRSAVGEGEG